MGSFCMGQEQFVSGRYSAVSCVTDLIDKDMIR